MNKIFAIIIIGLLLTGCSIGEKKLKVFTLEEPRAKLDIDMPTPLVMEKIRWIIITSEKAEEVFAKLKEQNIDPVLFAYTDEDWELVTKNNVRMRNTIIKLRAIIEAYKEYYEPEESQGKNSIIKSTPSEFEPKSFDKDKD